MSNNIVELTGVRRTLVQEQRLIIKLLAALVALAILTVGGCVGLENYMAIQAYNEAARTGRDPLRIACARAVDGSGISSASQRVAICANVSLQKNGAP